MGPSPDGRPQPEGGPPTYDKVIKRESRQYEPELDVTTNLPKNIRRESSLQVNTQNQSQQNNDEYIKYLIGFIGVMALLT